MWALVFHESHYCSTWLRLRVKIAYNIQLGLRSNWSEADLSDGWSVIWPGKPVHSFMLEGESFLVQDLSPIKRPNLWRVTIQVDVLVGIRLIIDFWVLTKKKGCMCLVFLILGRKNQFYTFPTLFGFMLDLFFKINYRFKR